MRVLIPGVIQSLTMTMNNRFFFLHLFIRTPCATVAIAQKESYPNYLIKIEKNYNYLVAKTFKECFDIHNSEKDYIVITN